MQQERQPVTLLEAQKTNLSAQKSAFSSLASKLSSLQSAADELKEKSAFQASAATVSDSTRVSFSAGSSAARGTYRDHRQQARPGAGLAEQRPGRRGHDGRRQRWHHQFRHRSRRDDHGTGHTERSRRGDQQSETAGVSASVVKNASGYHLMITGQETGAADGVHHVGRRAHRRVGRAELHPASDGTGRRDPAQRRHGHERDEHVRRRPSPGASFTVLKQDSRTRSSSRSPPATTR